MIAPSKNMLPLLGQYRSLREESKRIYQRQEVIREELSLLEHKLHLALIKSMVGQEVKPAFIDGLPDKIKGKSGTLIECRRTRCVIDFGDAGKFGFFIRDVVPTCQPLGWAINWMEVQQ